MCVTKEKFAFVFDVCVYDNVFVCMYVQQNDKKYKYHKF